MNRKPLMFVSLDEIVIDHGPFTDIVITGSSFRRWPEWRIEAYYADRLRWKRWGWLGRFGRPGRWISVLARVPLVEPADRSALITDCLFVDERATS